MVALDELVPVLRCPRCSGHLVVSGGVACAECDHALPYERGVLTALPEGAAGAANADFYGQDDERRYGRDGESMDPSSRRWVQDFVRGLSEAELVVEIGAGNGAFAGIHPRHVATDLSRVALEAHGAGVRVQADATALPFADGTAGAIFSVFAIEHVPHPERALAEIDRVLAPGGTALLYPAWFVRRWASRGIELRSWQELTRLEKAERVTVPVRNTKAWRLVRIIPGRISREARLARGRRDLPFAYAERRPNLQEYLGPDSDAFNSMDPEAMSAWFRSRGYTDANRTRPLQHLLYGYEPVVVRKPGERR